MPDAIGLIALLKPYLPILVFFLSVGLVTELILLKTDILSRRWRGSEVGWSSRHNKNVKRTLTWIIRVYKSLGFNFKTSSTIREVMGDLSNKLPDQGENLTFIMRSLEDHIYGDSEISHDDFIYYSQWNKFAKSYAKSK